MIRNNLLEFQIAAAEIGIFCWSVTINKYSMNWITSESAKIIFLAIAVVFTHYYPEFTLFLTYSSKIGSIAAHLIAEK